MPKRKSSVWQRQMFVVLVIAVFSFVIGWNLPRQLAITQVNKPVPQVVSPTPVKKISTFFSVPSEFQGKVIAETKLPLKDKVIALTFDDGPWPRTTAQVLDILKRNDIKATFFWIGKNVKSFPEIAQLVVDAGHVIGNHTWHHWYRRMDATTAAREIEDTAAQIYETVGVKTSLFRPPGGFLNNGPASYAEKQKYTVMMWSADSRDWFYRLASPQVLINNVLKEAQPGGIVLMHDGGGDRSKTVKALPQLIDGLRQRGYKFVTVPELLALKDKEQKLAPLPETKQKATQKPKSKHSSQKISPG